MLEKSDHKIVYLSEAKTKYMLYLENNDTDFKMVGKNLKCSIEQNLSNIKLLTVNNKNIIYPDCLVFEDVLELYLKMKENIRKSENTNKVLQSVVSSASCIRNDQQISSNQIHWPPKTGNLDVQTFLTFHYFKNF